jgi:hypothetical protein
VKKAKELPYYASQRQAAAVNNIDVELVRQACTEDPSITRAAGRIDKARLAEWLKDFAWKKTAPTGDDEDSPGAGGVVTLTEIKRLRELVALKREEIKLDKERDSLLPLKDFEAALSATVGAFIATINQVPGRASQKIVARARVAIVDMLRGTLTAKQFEKIEAVLDSASIEYGEIQQIIELELEHARQVLAQCAFLEEPVKTPDPVATAAPRPESPPAPRRRTSGKPRGKRPVRRKPASRKGTADTAAS